MNVQSRVNEKDGVIDVMFLFEFREKCLG